MTYVIFRHLQHFSFMIMNTKSNVSPDRPSYFQLFLVHHHQTCTGLNDEYGNTSSVQVWWNRKHKSSKEFEGRRWPQSPIMKIIIIITIMLILIFSQWLIMIIFVIKTIANAYDHNLNPPHPSFLPTWVVHPPIFSRPKMSTRFPATSASF